MDHHSLLGFMSLVWIFPSPTWSLKPSTLQKIDYIEEPHYRSITLDNEYLEHILMPRNMCQSRGKGGVFSVTYKPTSTLLFEVYELCGYFSDKPVDCDTVIIMGRLGHSPFDREVLSCQYQPKSYCTRHDEMKISFLIKNYCELGALKIKWKERFRRTFFLNHRLECPRSLISNEKRGTVLSQYEPDWQTSQVFCGITLDVPDSDRIIFCFEFVTYMAGDVLEIKVDDCVMEFGDGHLGNPDEQICLKRDLMLPVTLKAIRQTVQEQKHFYLLHYFFRKEKDRNYVESECPVKKRTVDDDENEDLEPYEIVLICLGTVVALIIFYKCCCRKGKNLQEACSRNLHQRGDRISCEPVADYRVPSPRREESIIWASEALPLAREPSPLELQSSSAGISTFLTTTTTTRTTTTTSDFLVDPPSYSSLFPEAE